MEMCRVCLTTEKVVHPLDETFVIHYNLLTNLNISLLDGMSQFSCNSCLDNVKYFIEFREKSIESETTLRAIFFSSLKKENKEIELQNEAESKVEYKKLKHEFECEIKVEPVYENDTTLDNFDIAFENYDEDLKNLVKNEDKKRKKLMKKKTRKKTRKKTKESELVLNSFDHNKWFCGICPETFEEKIEVNKHLDIHKDDRQCELCKEKMNSVSQLLAHRLMHVPSNQYNCHICAKRYKSCIYLEYHYRNTHYEGEDPKLMCSFCNSSYSNPKRLTSHILHVHSNKRFVCDICSKSFGSKSCLKSHIKHHSQNKSYVCDICGFSCNYSGGMKDHKIRKHSQKKIYCKNCSRPFSSQLDYDRHKCKSKLRVCPICGVQLTGGSRLSRHMVRHSDVHSYQCDRCPAKYKSRGALVAHLDRHDGNRTKQCEYCPAKFYTTTVLIKHRRTHTGEKPYVCKVCNKGFTGGHNLKVHMKVHGEYLVVKKNPEPDINNITK